MPSTFQSFGHSLGQLVSTSALILLLAGCAAQDSASEAAAEEAASDAKAKAAAVAADSQESLAQAEQTEANSDTPAQGDQPQGKSAAVTKLQQLFPNISADDISETPVNGFYQMVLGATVLYVSEDGRYMMQGDLIDLDTQSNLTDQVRSGLRVDMLEAVSADNSLLFAPENTKYTVSVFTDIDCGYCRRMHQQMAQYHDEGIAIRYLFYPRSGIGQDSAKKAEAVWCADDRHTAMTMAKSGQPLTRTECENPIANHYRLGRQIGVRGTPAIYTAAGTEIGGYVPAKDLARLLAEDAGS